MLKLKMDAKENVSQLYRTYGKKIYNLAYRMTGNTDDAEDITQETFIRALRGIDGFKGQSHVYTWLYTIAKNVSYRFLKNRETGSFESMEVLIRTTGEKPPAEIAQWEKQYLINQIKEGCLTGLLKCLSFYQRLAFILHVLLEMPLKEVATIAGKSEGAAKVLVHRARQNLKEFLCKNCSLYNPGNSCTCENLISFSLKKGWIQRPAHSHQDRLDLGQSLLNAAVIENEIAEVKKIYSLYKSLPNHVQPVDSEKRIQAIIKGNKLAIFNKKKV